MGQSQEIEALLAEYCQSTGMTREEAIKEILAAAAAQNPNLFGQIQPEEDEVDKALKEHALWQLRLQKAQYNSQYYGTIVKGVVILAFLAIVAIGYHLYRSTGSLPEWMQYWFR